MDLCARRQSRSSEYVEYQEKDGPSGKGRGGFKSKSDRNLDGASKEVFIAIEMKQGVYNRNE